MLLGLTTLAVLLWLVLRRLRTAQVQPSRDVTEEKDCSGRRW